MTTPELSEKEVVALYAAGNLPPWIEVVNVPITVGYQDWYVTSHDPHTGQPLDKLSGEALPARNLIEAQSVTDTVTINEYKINGKAIYAGYSDKTKTLIVGEVEAASEAAEGDE